MVKPLGVGGSKKWTEAITGQLENKQENLNVQMIPLNQIKLDPDNARKLLLTLEDIKNGPKLKGTNFDELAQSQFKEELSEYFKNDKNAVVKQEEYFSLALLANNIGSPQNLINPITVFMQDMEFHLIAGHRRTLAHHIMGVTKIAAKILKKEPTSLEHTILQWNENENREDLNLAEQLNHIEKIVKIWEKENSSTISVRKLMALLSLKKTKATWFLKVIKNEDNILKKAIKNNLIQSLEIAYNLASMDDKESCHQLLKQMESDKRLPFDQIIFETKKHKPSGRTPTDPEQKSVFGLHLSKSANPTIISEMISTIIQSQKFQKYKHDFKELDLTSKNGTFLAWNKIYLVLEQEQTKKDKKSG